MRFKAIGLPLLEYPVGKNCSKRKHTDGCRTNSRERRCGKSSVVALDTRCRSGDTATGRRTRVSRAMPHICCGDCFAQRSTDCAIGQRKLESKGCSCRPRLGAIARQARADPRDKTHPSCHHALHQKTVSAEPRLVWTHVLVSLHSRPWRTTLSVGWINFQPLLLSEYVHSAAVAPAS